MHFREDLRKSKELEEFIISNTKNMNEFNVIEVYYSSIDKIKELQFSDSLEDAVIENTRSRFRIFILVSSAISSINKYNIISKINEYV